MWQWSYNKRWFIQYEKNIWYRLENHACYLKKVLLCQNCSQYCYAKIVHKVQIQWMSTNSLATTSSVFILTQITQTTLSMHLFNGLLTYNMYVYVSEAYYIKLNTKYMEIHGNIYRFCLENMFSFCMVISVKFPKS